MSDSIHYWNYMYRLLAQHAHTHTQPMKLLFYDYNYTHDFDPHKDDDTEQYQENGSIDTNVVATHCIISDITKQCCLRHYVRLQGD